MKARAVVKRVSALWLRFNAGRGTGATRSRIALEDLEAVARI